MDDLEWIRESNLIEDIDDPAEDQRSLEAWQEIQPLPMSLLMIRWAHYNIMRHMRPDIAGHFRTCGVTVGGRSGPSWQQVPSLLDNWVHQCAALATPDAIHAAHIRFEKIHPFEDGNGRTGRMIMNWHRVRIGVEPLLLKASERQKYYQWFR
jgi:Fic family protein